MGRRVEVATLRTGRHHQLIQDERGEYDEVHITVTRDENDIDPLMPSIGLSVDGKEAKVLQVDRCDHKVFRVVTDLGTLYVHNYCCIGVDQSAWESR